MIHRKAALLSLALLAPVSVVAHSDAPPSPRPLAYSDEEFGARVRNYLLKNPEVLFEAIKTYENRQLEAQRVQDVNLISLYAEDLYNDGYSWVGGNPDGDVTIVEFFDYRCGFCRKAFPVVQELLEKDGNVRYIAKEFPILGPDSLTYSRFALAVRNTAGDEAYASVKAALNNIEGPATDMALERLSSVLGLDFSIIKPAMEDEEITAYLESNRELAKALKITGTPGFVFETQMVRGFIPFEDMQMIVAGIRGGRE